MSVSAMPSLFGCDPDTYASHEIHSGERTYRETNCYTDILIEMLHARGDEPLAAMGFIAGIDFEGDQWTFFKPDPADLVALFGVDIHEMQPYRPLPQQIEQQIEEGRTLIVELDSWYLPDLVSTSYRTEHVKTSAVMEAIDTDGERLRYFHNAGLYELEGEDYRGVFRIGGGFSDDVLPPYTELVRFDAGPRLTGEELRAKARELLAGHLARRPPAGGFDRFGAALARDLPGLLEGDVENYHAYAFATVRMVGSAAEVFRSHVDWLLGAEGAEASEDLQAVADGSKKLSLKLARRREFDPAPIVASMSEPWERALARLDAAVG